MAKRSRDASFSPPAGETSSSASPDLDEFESTRRTKINAFTGELHTNFPVMQCNLPPHRQALDFDSVEAFELHYSKDHSNRCSACEKNFPTAHLLSLHIDENHNPLREELQAKGEKTFGCFVEDCEKKCSTPQKRRLHLIDKHLFPKNYHFRIVDTGIDKSTTMLYENPRQRRRVSTAAAPADKAVRHRRSSSQTFSANLSSQLALSNADRAPKKSHFTKRRSQSSQVPPGETTQDAVPVQSSGIEELEQSMSALRFVPPSVLNRQRKNTQT